MWNSQHPLQTFPLSVSLAFYKKRNAFANSLGTGLVFILVASGEIPLTPWSLPP